jgi:hypothetical protein
MARREVTGKKPGVSADLIRSGSPDPDDDETDDEADDGEAIDDAAAVDDEDEDDEPTQPDGPAAEASATPPPIRGPPPLPAVRMAFSIPEFCKAFRISPDFYYKLKRRHQGPREMKVGKRTLISMEAANDWRIAREQATAAKAKTAAAETA